MAKLLKDKRELGVIRIMPVINKPVGIVSYGAQLPSWSLPIKELEMAHDKEIGVVSNSLLVEQKTVPDFDEDTITLSISAAWQALSRAKITKKFDSKKISALFIGSESHPYAVKPSGTVVAEALGLSEKLALADLQFACKAGTQGMQICASYILSNFAEYTLAIGADVAQAKPGDALEYTAAAGAAAFIFGHTNLLAKLLATSSVASDTPDFWRKSGEAYPHHGGRFTGKPAYFYHVIKSSKMLLKEAGLRAEDFDYCVFHTPNGKFPLQAAKQLGFSLKQLKPGLIVKNVGNTYAGSVPLALAAVLDQAPAGKKIFVTAYGSGAGADSFILETTNNLPIQREKWQDFTLDKIQNLQPINYQQYVRLTKNRYH